MKRILNLFIAVAFILNTLLPYNVFAQTLPMPGTMLQASPAFNPVVLKGIKLDADNPFNFSFILDEGNTKLSDTQLKDEADTLIRYFLCALTTPESDLWVNLSPYESNRIIPKHLGDTELGQGFLAQDYILKQLSASLTYPETEAGRAYWSNFKSQISNLPSKDALGGQKSNAPALAKVWIKPDSTRIIESGLTAVIKEATLKVETEDTNAQALKANILPILKTEVNAGKNFAAFRQMHSAVVLAAWFKLRLKDSIYKQLYIDKKKFAGIEANDPNAVNNIYNQYVEAFKKGAYNYTKAERNFNKITKRAYFCGGVQESVTPTMQRTTVDPTVVDKEIAGSTLANGVMQSADSSDTKWQENVESLLAEHGMLLTENQMWQLSLIHKRGAGWSWAPEGAVVGQKIPDVTVYDANGKEQKREVTVVRGSDGKLRITRNTQEVNQAKRDDAIALLSEIGATPEHIKAAVKDLMDTGLLGRRTTVAALVTGALAAGTILGTALHSDDKKVTVSGQPPAIVSSQPTVAQRPIASDAGGEVEKTRNEALPEDGVKKDTKESLIAAREKIAGKFGTLNDDKVSDFYEENHLTTLEDMFFPLSADKDYFPRHFRYGVGGRGFSELNFKAIAKIEKLSRIAVRQAVAGYDDDARVSFKMAISAVSELRAQVSRYFNKQMAYINEVANRPPHSSVFSKNFLLNDLQQSLAYDQSLYNSDYFDRVVAGIALSQKGAGMLQDARRTATGYIVNQQILAKVLGEINDDKTKLYDLIDGGIKLALAGDRAKASNAFALARQLAVVSDNKLIYMRVEDYRDGGLILDVVRGQIAAGLLNDALITAVNIAPSASPRDYWGVSDDRELAFSAIIDKQVELCLFDDALRTIRYLSNSSDYPNYIKGLKEEFSRMMPERQVWRKNIAASFFGQGISLNNSVYNQLWDIHLRGKGWEFAPQGSKEGDIIKNKTVYDDDGNAVTRDVKVVKGSDGKLRVTLNTQEVNQKKRVDAIKVLTDAGVARIAAESAVNGLMDTGLLGEENKPDEPSAINGGIEENIVLKIENDGVAVPVFKNLPAALNDISGFKFNITQMVRNGGSRVF